MHAFCLEGLFGGLHKEEAMAETKSREEVISLVRYIGVTEQRIAAQIHQIEKQLKELTARKALDYPYYLTLQSVSTIDGLAAPQRPLGSALREDLAKLKKQMAELRATSKKIRLTNSWLDTLALKRQGTRTSQDLRRQIEANLKKSEARGAIDETSIGKLIDKVEENLRRFITVLEKDPTEENALNLLKELEIPLLFRGDYHRSSSEDAFKALSNAGAKWVAQGKEQFSKDPTAENLKSLLDQTGKAALLGTSDEALEIIDVVKQNAEKLKENAEDIFRQQPTIENFTVMEETDKFCFRLGKQPFPFPPVGLPPVSAGTIHVVKPGETLSAISKKYFGRPGYWDVIYRRNRDLIKNPDSLAPGTKLVIS
jgi:LysM repeat protein